MCSNTHKPTSHSYLSVCFLGVLLKHRKPFVPHTGDGVFVCETWIFGYVQMNFAAAHIRTRLIPCELCDRRQWIWNRSSSKCFRFFSCHYRSITDPSSSSSLQMEGCRTTWKHPSEVSLRDPGFWNGVAETTSFVWCYAMKMGKGLSTFREIVMPSSSE
jgi:hypothetical protein